MVIQWSPELTLNHDLLDPQHVTLFRLLDEAAAAVDGEPDALLHAVARFGEALVAHVAEEARVMEEAHYPDRSRHGASHDLLVADVLGVLTELATSGPSPRIRTVVSTHLPDWLRYHTRVNDGPLGAWLARNGPNPTPLEGRRRKSPTRKLS
jgi:hemerythrin-like metal-binding protein